MTPVAKPSLISEKMPFFTSIKLSNDHSHNLPHR